MKDYTVLDGQITCLRNKLYDEAYKRGYEDAKKEFIGMSAKQIQIKYHDDFATALEKMYEYEERQNVKKVYEEKFMPIGRANMEKKREERQTENDAWKKHIYEELCLLADDEECSVDEIAEVLEQMRKESHETDT